MKKNPLPNFHNFAFEVKVELFVSKVKFKVLLISQRQANLPKFVETWPSRDATCYLGVPGKHLPHPTRRSLTPGLDVARYTGSDRHNSTSNPYNQ